MDSIIQAKIKKLFESNEEKKLQQKIGFIGKFYNTASYGDIYIANVIYSHKKVKDKKVSVDYIIKEGEHGLKVCIESKYLPICQQLNNLTKGDENRFKTLSNGLIQDMKLTRQIQSFNYRELGLDL
mgnify:CR=1 FL=1